MSISNVKSALYTDLSTLTTTNGYSTTIKKIYKVKKMPNEINASELPALCLFLANAPQKPFDEASKTSDLIYFIMIYTSSNSDTDDSGDVEQALYQIYEDIIILFNKQTTTTYKLDEVRGIEVLDFFPEVKDINGWAVVPLRIEYK